MKRSPGRSAAALAAIGMIAKLIGALYRVPLTNILGAEGMGIYQMVFPLYTILLAFCGGGISSAVSRAVAKYMSAGNEGATRRVVRAAILPLVALSAVTVAAVMLLGKRIAIFQGNVKATPAYLALLPSLMFSGGISVLRGYFQGRTLTAPSGVSQLIEQVVKLALGLWLSGRLMPYGVEYAATGALIGVSVSEAAALLYLTIRYRLLFRRGRAKMQLAHLNAEFASDAPSSSDRALIKELYAFALPIALGSLVLPVTQMIDSVLVINLIAASGAGREMATELFGLAVGPVGTLINMPAVVMTAVSVAYLPVMTAAAERGDEDAFGRYMRELVKWSAVFALPVAIAFALFPRRITLTLYGGLSPEQIAVAARLLRLQSVCVLYSGALQLATTALQARGRAHVPVVNLIAGACVKVVSTPFFIKAWGIYGAACSTVICFGVAALLDCRSAYSLKAIGADIKSGIIIPLVFCGAAAVAFNVGVYVAELFGAPYILQSVCGGAAFLAVYSGALAYCIRGKNNIRGVLRPEHAPKRQK